MPPEPNKKQSHNFLGIFDQDLDKETLAKLKEIIEEKEELEKHIANMQAKIEKGTNEIKKWEGVIISNSIEIASLDQKQQHINKLINKLKAEEEKTHYTLSDKKRIAADIMSSNQELNKVNARIKYLIIENYQLRKVLDEAKLEDDIKTLSDRLDERLNELNIINTLIQDYLSQDKKKAPDIRYRIGIAG